MKDDLKEIYSDVKSWLIYGETKNGVLLGIQLALLGALLKEKDNILKELAKNLYYSILIGLLLATLIIILSFIPFLMGKIQLKGNPNTSNLIFYKNLSFYKSIADLENAYISSFSQAQPLGKMEKDYIQQIYFISKIATNKFNAFILSMSVIGITIILSIFIAISNIK